MTVGLFLAVSLAGGLGAVCRFVLDLLIPRKGERRLPWSTILINVTGSFALGFLAGVASSRLLPEALAGVLSGGFLAGFTTFSTASTDTVQLFRARECARGLFNGLGVLLLAITAAGTGLLLGSLL